MNDIKKFTPHTGVNEVLDHLARGVKEIFQEKLVGFYLTGSLSYGDFDPGRSDIDLAAVLTGRATAEEATSVEQLHVTTEEIFPAWAGRIECSYIPREMLACKLPPAAPRPYFGNGIFYPAADYGNEWIINQYFLSECGIALIGPDFRTLLAGPIDITEVQKACVRDLYKEWTPRIVDPAPLGDPHLQSYIVLNLCRILCAVKAGKVWSKNAAASWAEERYPEQAHLIRAAGIWRYGNAFDHAEDTVDFLKFAIREIGPLA
jgi:hypothetical protein